jgi:hypothetical protein
VLGVVGGGFWSVTYLVRIWLILFFKLDVNAHRSANINAWYKDGFHVKEILKTIAYVIIKHLFTRLTGIIIKNAGML